MKELLFMRDEDKYIAIDEHVLNSFKMFKLRRNLNTWTPTVDPDRLKVLNVEGLVTQKDIAYLFHCGEVKARCILIDMMKCKHAFQLGKIYYTTENDTEAYIKELMGTQRCVIE